MDFFRKNYMCIKQHDNKDCGIACLATVARHYGLNMHLSKIRELSGTDSEGTTVYGILKAAKEMKLKSKAVKTEDLDDIFGQFPKPSIAHVVMEGSLMHYIVVHEVSEDKIIIADPSRGIVTYTPEEFYKIWTGIMILLAPSEYFEPKNEASGVLASFVSVLKQQKLILAKIFMLSLFVTVLGIFGSMYFQFLIDNILPINSRKSLGLLSMSIVFLMIFKEVVSYFRNILLVKLATNIDSKILLGYYKHVVELPMNFFETRQVGEILSRFNDGGTIRDALSSATLTLMIDSIMAIVGGFILYRQSHIMFFVCFIPIVIYLALVAIFKRPIEEESRKYMESNAKLDSYLVESLHGAEVIKSFNGESIVAGETEKRFMKFINSIIKLGYIENLQSSFKNCVQSVFLILIGWIGGILILDQQLSIGMLISFNALLIYFIGPIERIINLQGTLQSAMVAADRLGEILVLKKEKDNEEEKKIIPESLYGDIQFKDIYFRYGAKQLILKGINLNIKAGEKIAFVGESGSGKTTLVKLLMNFYDFEKGDISISGYDIKDISKEKLRDRIAYISQSSFFFSATIKENFLFSNPNVTDNEIVEACKQAHIHDYIESLQLKYDTVLEENGKNFSGGQIQRLAIARALIKKPDILIMDEATSNLDFITEKAIQNTIENCTENITTIIIAHRLSTIVKCDKIYVIDQGKVIEEGNHKELMGKDGYYSDLWKNGSNENI
ncbi:peptidase domain-containing ABC transporter [Clostridium cellulovorans]|uniref:ABC-type bacteriocin transporter n=1 Tax=Clostridium cellulovorans (strain ATCC 35296 / DSM 3052 / OCM 3 / 743B) TaxID=573061 RepID=D9SND0_CLOC7|nr:peptidase domain-containing ABC transporter [Clostridium cellulovorans]ADL53922.1 ABC-type bacteriocin transporter [Clostridium cellulovorans 743B]